MLSLEHKVYTAALKWKQGEMEALSLLDDASKDRLLPHIILPPLSAKDLEKKRLLTKEEFSRIQVGRLQRFWPSRPCLIDPRFLKFEPQDRGSDAGWINDFFETAKKFGCSLIPVLDANVDVYRVAAMAAYARNANSGAAIRIRLEDLQEEKLGDLLATLLAGVRLAAADCILVLDLSDAAIPNAPTFAKFISDRIAKLRHFGLWKRIVVEASNYPTKNPAKPNSEARSARAEWLAWRHLIEADRRISEWASFGDFGADHGHINFDGGGRVVTHVRYATGKDWIINRGGSATSGHDGTIHEVAKRIVSSSEFMGADFSVGDELLTLWADRVSAGNATKWRCANMIHHMTLATAGAANLIGASFERSQRDPIARQLSLMDLAKA